jgi:MtaA/CmuA family methyltransferase
VDRITAVIQHKAKRAVFPLVCTDHCAWLCHTDLEEVLTDAHKLAEVIECAYLNYRYDMVLVFSDAYVEAQALGCPVQLTPFPTLVGPCTTHTIDRTDIVLQAASRLMQQLPVPVFVSIKGVFSLASFLAGIKEFLIMILKYPENAQQYIDRALKFQVSYVDKLLACGAHIFIGDPVASSSVISPEMFVKHAYEPLRMLVARIKEHGALAGIHICGNTKPIINDLDSVSADILSIEDVAVRTKTLKMGSVSTHTIRHGLPSDISREIQATANEPFLIHSTACDVPADTPPENILHMIHHSHDYGND